MIRVPINLASEPFRPRRAPLVALTTAAVLLATALAAQIGLAWNERRVAAHERAEIARLNASGCCRSCGAVSTGPSGCAGR